MLCNVHRSTLNFIYTTPFRGNMFFFFFLTLNQQTNTACLISRVGTNLKQTKKSVSGSLKKHWTKLCLCLCTCTETQPCSLSCNWIMSTSWQEQSFVNSAVFDFISSMATSTGLSSTCFSPTTSTRFFTYGKVLAAVDRRNGVNKKTQTNTSWHCTVPYRLKSDNNTSHFNDSLTRARINQSQQASISTSCLHCVLHTCKDNPPFALLLHPTVLFPWQRVGCLKDEAVDVVTLLEVRLLLRYLLLLKVRLDKRHLHVGKLGVQVFGVHLWETTNFYQSVLVLQTCVLVMCPSTYLFSNQSLPSNTT